MRIIKIIIFLEIIIFSIDLNGQYFPSRQYMAADGMLSNSVFDIAQHPSGMMWFINKMGPAYYDTKDWVTFPDSLNLPSSFNSKIAITDGVVWVAGLNDTTFTIQYYKGNWQPIHIPLNSAKLNTHISFNVAGNSDEFHVLLAFGNQLNYYNSLSYKWTSIDLGSTSIYNIHNFNNDLYLATSDGLSIFKEGKIEKVRLPYNQLPSDTILAIDFKKDTFYLLGFDWYAEISDNQIRLLTEDIGLSQQSLHYSSSIVVDQNDLVLYGSHTPARILDRKNKAWQDLLIEGLNLGSTRVFCDAENNIWVGDSRGLFKFNVLQFLNYNKNSGLLNDEVTVVKELHDKTIILANPTSFNTVKNNTIKNFQLDLKKDLLYRIMDIEEDPVTRQVFMAANDGGLFVFDPSRFEKPSEIIFLKNDHITSVEYHKNDLYMAGSKGLFKLQNGRPKKVDSIRDIRNMVSLGNCLALLTNSQGLYLYHGNKLKQYKSKNFDLSSVYQIVMYQGDTLLATKDGIGTFNNEEIIHWDQFANKTPIYSLLVDRKNGLWIGADHGVYHYSNKTLKLYDVNEGLTGNEINRNALIQDAEGNIWIGTEKGASVFKGDAERHKSLNLNVDITNVTTRKGKSLLSNSKNVVSFDDNGIQISFVCLSYVDEEKVNFRYRIDQSENEWIETSNSKDDIVFSNLNYGQYQFEIQARLKSGEWGPVTQFKFSVGKPFYLSWWFIVLSVLLLLAIARIIFSFRYMLLIKQQKKLKEEVSERTKEILELNIQLEEKVKLRTKELEDKNFRLEEYAYINAHYLRGPLSKIMSALIVADSNEGTLLDENLIRILKESVKELDAVIYSINDILKE